MPNLDPNNSTQHPTLYTDPETFDDPIRKLDADAAATFDNSHSTSTEWARGEALDTDLEIDDTSLQLRTVGGEEEDVVDDDEDDEDDENEEDEDDDEDEADEEDLDLR